MSAETVAFVGRLKCDTPLDKLILMRFADQCDGRGQAFIDAPEYADFCGVDLFAFTDAMLRLVNGGLLQYDRIYRYTLVGFVRGKS